jgi:predicted O-methyltransferase YrrM
MSQELWTKVDAYIEEMLVGEDEALMEARRASEGAGLPAIAVTPGQGKLLMLMAQMIGARKILEVGTLGGYSTIWLARALPEGGRVITLEYEEKHAAVARKNIARAGLSEVVELQVGDARETMPRLLAEGRAPFDLIFIDANKDGCPNYFKWSVEMSRKGSVIIVDNVVRDGAVIDPGSKDPNIQGIRRFNEMAGVEPGVSATALQTVGSKGYDGFAVMLLK